MTIHDGQPYLRYGMAQWQHSAWVNWLYSSSVPSAERLREYSKVFQSVEVGSTFYTDIEENQLKRWYDQVNDDFRFCFKAPQTVTHQIVERPFQERLTDWKRFQMKLASLDKKLGPTMVQFPQQLDASSLPEILALIESWELLAPLSIEVRHLHYFDKGEVESEFLRYLSNQSVDKVVMDSRPVFSTEAYSESLKDAQRKKPRVPCHAVATAQSPVVRFIGHPDLERNHVWLDQWAAKLKSWLERGLKPTVFVHSSDNIAAPTLASWLDDKLVANSALPFKQVNLPETQEQIALL
ncbi:DUF72 domain-containing protein [Marinomonas mediterranea]|jgi:Uncharacterized conserved protein|uniref:DUF72 domain-containing protein n=1 Tax=Marinomonas mediterranea (strain ATCC 700492 / JCM 21426 / NBRC 103028 / MMB-1) TaxID=717774 RepID=F2K1W9_MARM1|nr:DUF72 domain-containing protein [Marinomonas mediterranea]ADZ89963.1 protein of unknown function DUF72 [Marinomonas mediterranea MMB-1]WCN16172.1 DUF72 domain-containing protein [Marinomonas mediterranea MMB-1]